jgi:hypothetical protein
MLRCTPTRARQPPNNRPDDDAWVDQVADEVQALLREHGLEMELCVWYDPITEQLHGVGYDGAPARFFANLPSSSAPSDSQAPRGNPMSDIINHPAAKRPETNLKAYL